MLRLLLVSNMQITSSGPSMNSPSVITTSIHHSYPQLTALPVQSQLYQMNDLSPNAYQNNMLDMIKMENANNNSSKIMDLEIKHRHSMAGQSH